MASWKNLLEQKIREENITKEEAITWVNDSYEYNLFESEDEKNELLAIIESLFHSE